MKAAHVGMRGGAALLALVMGACTDSAPAVPGLASELHLVPDTVNLAAGATVRLQPIFVGGDPEPLKYLAADPSVASVDSAGEIRARWPGTTLVSAASTARPALSASSRIVVRGPALRFVPDSTDVPAGWGGRTLAVETSGVPPTRFLFRSSDTLVARVDSTGFVCGASKGKAWVEARAAVDTTIRDRATVNVVQGVIPPLPPPWLVFFTTPDGQTVNTQAVTGTILIKASWHDYTCEPNYSTTVRLRLNNTVVASVPGRSWLSDSVTFTLDTRANDATGHPRYPDGRYDVRVEWIPETGPMILGAAVTFYTNFVNGL